ncbi:MAG: hypothetical protein FWC57_04425, partial [Endomicrobia bacterium]|nr:hypothetical protein [Endomicrobiia bacterium]
YKYRPMTPEELKAAIIAGRLQIAANDSKNKDKYPELKNISLHISDGGRVFDEKTKKYKADGSFQFFYDKATNKFAGTKGGDGLYEVDVNLYKSDGTEMSMDELLLAMLNAGELKNLETQVKAEYPNVAVEFDRGNLMWRINGYLINPMEDALPAKAGQLDKYNRVHVKTLDQIKQDAENAPKFEKIKQEARKEGISVEQRGSNIEVKKTWMANAKAGFKGEKPNNAVATIPFSSLLKDDNKTLKDKNGEDGAVQVLSDALVLRQRTDDLVSEGFSIVEYLKRNEANTGNNLWWNVTHSDYKNEDGTPMALDVPAVDPNRITDTHTDKFISKDLADTAFRVEQIVKSGAKKGYTVIKSKDEQGFDRLTVYRKDGATVNKQPVTANIPSYNIDGQPVDWEKIDRALGLEQLRLEMINEFGFTIPDPADGTPNLVMKDESGKVVKDKNGKEVKVIRILENGRHKYVLKDNRNIEVSRNNVDSILEWQISHPQYSNKDAKPAIFYPYVEQPVAKLGDKPEAIPINELKTKDVIRKDFVDAIRTYQLVDALKAKYPQYDFEPKSSEYTLNKKMGMLESVQIIAVRDRHGKFIADIPVKDGALNSIGSYYNDEKAYGGKDDKEIKSNNAAILENALNQFAVKLDMAPKLAALEKQNGITEDRKVYRYFDKDGKEYNVSVDKSGNRTVTDMNGKQIANQNIHLEEVLFWKITGDDGVEYLINPVKKEDGKTVLVDINKARADMQAFRKLREECVNAGVKILANPDANPAYPQEIYNKTSYNYNYYDNNQNLYWMVAGYDGITFDKPVKIYPKGPYTSSPDAIKTAAQNEANNAYARSHGADGAFRQDWGQPQWQPQNQPQRQTPQQQSTTPQQRAIQRMQNNLNRQLQQFNQNNQPQGQQQQQMQPQTQSSQGQQQQNQTPQQQSIQRMQNTLNRQLQQFNQNNQQQAASASPVAQAVMQTRASAPILMGSSPRLMMISISPSFIASVLSFIYAHFIGKGTAGTTASASGQTASAATEAQSVSSDNVNKTYNKEEDLKKIWDLVKDSYDEYPVPGKNKDGVDIVKEKVIVTADGIRINDRGELIVVYSEKHLVPSDSKKEITLQEYKDNISKKKFNEINDAESDNFKVDYVSAYVQYKGATYRQDIRKEHKADKDYGVFASSLYYIDENAESMPDGKTIYKNYVFNINDISGNKDVTSIIGKAGTKSIVIHKYNMGGKIIYLQQVYGDYYDRRGADRREIINSVNNANNGNISKEVKAKLGNISPVRAFFGGKIEFNDDKGKPVASFDSNTIDAESLKQAHILFRDVNGKRLFFSNSSVSLNPGDDGKTELTVSDNNFFKTDEYTYIDEKGDTIIATKTTNQEK